MRQLPLFLIALAAIAVIASPALAQTPCEQFGSGGGEIYLPPGCKYYSPAELHMIEDPAVQEALIAKPIHQFFVCHEQVTGGGTPGADCRQSGGSLGGSVEQFSSELVFELDGITPGVATYSRTLTIGNVAVEVHSGPQLPGSTQSFATEMKKIEGQLVGDQDFDFLRVVGGTDFGYPSPGHTQATFDPATNRWTIDSHFDVGYRIEFVGAPGGPLAGLSGTFVGTVRMEAFGK